MESAFYALQSILLNLPLYILCKIVYSTVLYFVYIKPGYSATKEAKMKTYKIFRRKRGLKIEINNENM